MRRAALLALLGDLLAVLAFVVVGRLSHSEPADPAGAAITAAPFLAGVALAWCARVVRNAPTTLRAGALVLACALLVGLIGRAFVTGRLPVSFVLVTAVTLGVLVLGWRAVALAIHAGQHRRRAQSSRRSTS